MVGAPNGLEAVFKTLLVRGQELGEGVEGEGCVLETCGFVYSGREAGDVHDRDTVVFIVIGNEGNERIPVNHVGAEEVGVEIDRSVILRGAQNNKSELGWGDDFRAGAVCADVWVVRAGGMRNDSNVSS